MGRSSYHHSDHFAKSVFISDYSIAVSRTTIFISCKTSHESSIQSFTLTMELELQQCQDVNELVTKAGQLLEQCDITNACICLRRAVDVEPENADLLDALAEVLLDDGQVEEGAKVSFTILPLSSLARGQFADGSFLVPGFEKEY